tara:strand:- start:29 stop:244 length:216 start_codon:yes stop_codon:yes gene_type:complete
MGVLIQGAENTRHIRNLALLKALRLEILGMNRSKASSAYSIIKKENNLKGSKMKVFKQFESIIRRSINDNK